MINHHAKKDVSVRIADSYASKGRELRDSRWRCLLPIDRAASLIGVSAEQLIKDEKGEVKSVDYLYAERSENYRIFYKEYESKNRMRILTGAADNGETQTDICDRIAALMKAKDLRYETLRDMTGIPKSRLHRYATVPMQKIPIVDIIKMAQALDVTTEYLLGWPKEGEQKQEHEQPPHYFNRKIALIRKELGITSAEIAKQLEMDESEYLVCESSEKPMPLTSMARICALAKITINTIVDLPCNRRA